MSDILTVSHSLQEMLEVISSCQQDAKNGTDPLASDLTPWDTTPPRVLSAIQKILAEESLEHATGVARHVRDFIRATKSDAFRASHLVAATAHQLAVKIRIDFIDRVVPTWDNYLDGIEAVGGLDWLYERGIFIGLEYNGFMYDDDECEAILEKDPDAQIRRCWNVTKEVRQRMAIDSGAEYIWSGLLSLAEFDADELKALIERERAFIESPPDMSAKPDQREWTGRIAPKKAHTLFPEIMEYDVGDSRNGAWKRHAQRLEAEGKLERFKSGKSVMIHVSAIPPDSSWWKSTEKPA